MTAFPRAADGATSPLSAQATPAVAAATIATRYCPSTPMLKMPALKQTETASAEKMSGVAIART